MKDLNHIADEIVLRGLDDWMYLAEIESLVRFLGVDRTKVIDYTQKVLGVLLDRGMIQLGEVIDDKFEPWRGQPEDVIANLKRKRAMFDGDIGMGEVCWIDLTESGVAKARIVESLRSRKDNNIDGGPGEFSV
jgi:hypothetical protein